MDPHSLTNQKILIKYMHHCSIFFQQFDSWLILFMGGRRINLEYYEGTFVIFSIQKDGSSDEEEDGD